MVESPIRQERSILRALYWAMLHARLRSVRPRLARVRVEYVRGIPIVVLPNVFDGILIRTGAFLVEAFAEEKFSAATRVLDLGTGSGLGAIFAALYGAQVFATDINPEAARNSKINALALHLEHKIETRVGDLFEPVRDIKFDLILFNPPYYRGQPRDLADAAWRSPDAFDRFLRELPDRLTLYGRALVVLSSDGEVAAALECATNLRVRVARRRDFINETLTVYEIRAHEEKT